MAANGPDEFVARGWSNLVTPEEGHRHVRASRRLHHLAGRLRLGRGLARVLRPRGPGPPRLARRAARGHLPHGREPLPPHPPPPPPHPPPAPSPDPRRP